MSRPNWFFAFPVDGTFLLEVSEPPTNIRRYHPDDAHLTVAFLGGCGEGSAMRALDALDGLLPILRPKPIEITLGSVEPMGPKSRYSALSAMLRQGRAEAAALLGLMRDTLTETAIGRRERREPKPHVTLARPRRRATEEQRASGLTWARELNLDGARSCLDRVALYTWSDDRRERLFRVVAERRLG